MKLFLKKIRLILIKSEIRRLSRLIALDIVVSMLDILFLILLLFFVAHYTGRDQSTMPVTWLKPEIISQPVLLFGAFCGLFALKNFFAYYVIKQQTSYIYSIAARLAADKLSSYLGGDYQKYVYTDSSVHTRHIHHDAIEFSHHVLRGIQQVISQSVLILIALVPLVIFQPMLSLLLSLVLLPPLFLSALLIRKKLRTLRLTGRLLYQKLIQYLKEAISGFVESKVYDKKQFFLGRFNAIQEKHLQNLADEQVAQSLPSRLLEVFVVFGLFSLVLIHQYIKSDPDLNIITLGAFAAASYKIIPGIVKLMNGAAQVRNYWFTVDNLAAGENFSPIEEKDVTVRSVQFADVCFNFPDKSVLQNLSFDFRSGDMVGISGLSGKGKTTIVNLLLGFLKPDKGTVKINGNGLAPELARRRIAYVKQQPFFIHDTLLRNITLDDLIPDEEKLKEVLTVTGLDEVIKKLNDGIHTLISEAGKNLSGGQRQRVMLARALYKDFDVLILDEPFSELDTEAEVLILEYLRQVAAEGRIIIIITHNEASLLHCNQELVLNGQA